MGRRTAPYGGGGRDLGIINSRSRSASGAEQLVLLLLRHPAVVAGALDDGQIRRSPGPGRGDSVPKCG